MTTAHATHPLLTRAPERICFAGDWHGNTHFAGGRLMSAAAAGADLVIQVGDFGLWGGNGGAMYRYSLEKICARYNLPILWIDGNHEDFDLLEGLPREHGLGRVSEHIWHLPRGTRWQWGDLRWGALGGASSVDRRLRLPLIDWWPAEELSPQDAAAWLDGGPVDVVVTHDAPAGISIPGITHAAGVSWWGLEAITRADAHRILLADTLTPSRPGLVVHGHYHVRYEGTWHYPGGKAHVVGLDCDNYLPPRNTWLVDLAEIGQIVRNQREGQ